LLIDRLLIDRLLIDRLLPTSNPHIFFCSMTSFGKKRRSVSLDAAKLRQELDYFSLSKDEAVAERKANRKKSEIAGRVGGD
jgi:hypothetical protein